MWRNYGLRSSITEGIIDIFIMQQTRPTNQTWDVTCCVLAVSGHCIAVFTVQLISLWCHHTRNTCNNRDLSFPWRQESVFWPPWLLSTAISVIFDIWFPKTAAHYVGSWRVHGTALCLWWFSKVLITLRAWSRCIHFNLRKEISPFSNFIICIFYY